MPQPIHDRQAEIHVSARVFTQTADLRESSNATAGNCRSFYRQPRELVSERFFQRILSLERKKAERSRKGILLMLLDIKRALRGNPSDRILSGIALALSSPTRETDVIGWHQTNSVLGLIFTDVYQRDRSALQNLMNSGIVANLRANLGDEQADQIRISFHFFPEDTDNQNGNRTIDDKLYPDLLERIHSTKLSRIAKRAVDILGSVFAIIVFAPLFALLSAAIKLTSKGPVLFRQERIGQYGRRFTFLKFRSMKCGSDPRIHQDYVTRFITGEIANANGVPFKIKDDPRLTRLGAFLRRCSLDELPQLINVLKGDMSLVGPRPAIPYEIDLYQVWHRTRFVEVKPGITGLWQVQGRSRTNFDDMVRLDLQYVKQWSFWLDIKILLQTPRAVLSREGAY